MKHSTLIKIAIVTTLSLLAVVQAHAECSSVLFRESYEVEAMREAHPATQFHTDASLPADYGVRLVHTPDNAKITDPFGVEHTTGGGYRYEIFKDGHMVFATTATPESQMDLVQIRLQMSQYLTQAGCR